jgi:hypothetical protein
LVANATLVPDGWASLDGRAIYAEARTAGFVHEAVFRRELGERLGVSSLRTSWYLPENAQDAVYRRPTSKAALMAADTGSGATVDRPPRAAAYGDERTSDAGS